MQRMIRLFILPSALLLGTALLLGLWPLHVGATPAVAAAGTAPDLIIESITINPPNPGIGDTADITVKVKNVGDAPTASAFRFYLYVDPATEPPDQNTTPTAQSASGLPLLPGGEFVYTRTDHTFTSADPKVYAWVDPPWENFVAESNEENNLFPRVNNGDSYEADNECGPALPAITTDGVEQIRNLNPDPATDVDWVQFDGKSGVTYYAQVIPTGDADLTMEVHASCNAFPPFGNTIITFTTPTDGIYYLKVYHNPVETYGTDSSYRLKISSDDACATTYEVNDVCAESGELTLNSAQTHSFCRRNDTDWTRFPVTAGSKYKITANNVGASANVQMSWFARCDDPAAASGQSVELTAPTAGFIYLKTVNANGDIHGAGTEYTLNVQPVGDLGCTEDALEQDDIIDQAKAQAVDSAPTTHNICPPGDEDWAKFSATAGVTYTLETMNVGSAGDTELCLLTSAGETLLCDDDEGAGKGSRILWQAPTVGDYLLRVKDHDPEVAGPDTTYDLQVRTYLCDQDEAEADNTQSAARVISADGTRHPRNICPAGDEDWFRFTATANAPFTLDTVDNGPEADTIISVYNEAGELLAENDDHAPGVSSHLIHTPAQSGTYFAKVRLYNPTNYGRGTEYSLRLRAGAIDPPTPDDPPAPDDPPPADPPQPSQAKTLILVNRTQLVRFYPEAGVDALLTELDNLARHAAVLGQVIRLDQNPTVSAAYAEWNKPENWTKVESANAVAAAIRQVIMSQRREQAAIEYLVLVGDDQALPFRRLNDNTPQSSEKIYTGTDTSHPTGAAQRANYFLSDDYYGTSEPVLFNQRELYIPDIAVGRLVETPTEMVATINNFVTVPMLNVTQDVNVLITGYDFVQDQARLDCEDWQIDLGGDRVDCALISEEWTGQQLRDRLFRTTDPFQIQMIAGHANHHAHGVPNGTALAAHEIVSANADWRGGLVYSPACHAGLNVPATNANATDLVQAVLTRGASYVANTGYGWGLHNSVGLSEKLIQLYTKELLTGAQSSLGTALITAKQRYYSATSRLNGYDEKILQELTFYGLPMQALQTGAVLSEDNEFPSVQVVKNLPTSDPALSTVEVGTVDLIFPQNLPLNTTTNGSYYELDNYNSAAPNEPVQPLHFDNFTVLNKEARGVVITGGSFTTQNNFNPAIPAPDNEYVTLMAEGSQQPVWQPAIPVDLQVLGEESYLVTQVGQYHAGEGTLRLYENLNLAIYYSTSTDQFPPQITVVDGVYSPTDGRVSVKVGAVDSSGIRNVVLTYIEDTHQTTGEINALELTFDVASQKWVGTFAGNGNSRFTVQVVDKAGNVTVANNKGAEFRPAMVTTLPTIERRIYLPVVLR